MSSGGSTRFTKGTSGNPAGRPRLRRPHVSAFDIIFDKVLSVTQNGVERELTIDEALQLQTYQAALKGGRMAARQVLKMIEKREVAIARITPAPVASTRMQIEHDSANANEALEILGIAGYGPAEAGGGPATRPLRIATWAAQAAISRPGRGRADANDQEEIKRCVLDPDKLRWPKQRLR